MEIHKLLFRPSTSGRASGEVDEKDGVVFFPPDVNAGL